MKHPNEEELRGFSFSFSDKICLDGYVIVPIEKYGDDETNNLVELQRKIND